jgi:hypothetical protein
MDNQEEHDDGKKTNLDKVDIKRLHSYIMKMSKDLKQFEGELMTESLMMSIRNRLWEQIEKINQEHLIGFDIKYFKCTKVRNTLEFHYELPSSFFEGHTAKELRDSGLKIDEKIPDKAVMQNNIWKS